VTITTDPPVAVQIDGETLGETPLTAEIVCSGVHLIVGKRYRESPDYGGFLEELKLNQLWTRHKSH
jgi:hypothetical protein